MASMTLAYGASVLAALCAGLLALVQRYGVAPIAAAQGTRVPAAAPFAMTTAVAPHAAHSTTTAVDRKADDRVLPRGRRL